MANSDGTERAVTTGEANGGELIGKVLGGRYRVTSVIGRGGMGVVARAVDELLNREVAVKVLRAFTDASTAELADLRTRMQREAQAAARIRHSGVVTVHDVTEERGLPVIVMELVEGCSLDDLLTERGTLEPHEAAAIGAKLMDALDAAHRVGVLHRDVKPANVLLEHGGRVVLTDFGIATMEASGDDAMAKLTRSGDIVGSLDYLPPERAQGREPGPASDIWSLGMTLYAAVEGTSPFRLTSAWSTLSAIVTEPLPEPRLAGPLTPVLRALMAKEPEDRPTADQARGMLEHVASGGTVPLASTEPASAPAPAPTPDPGAAAAAAPAPGFGPPLFPQPAPQPQPPHAGYPQPHLPSTLPQAGAPVAGPAGVPAPETSRSVARRARKRSRTTLTASAAAVLLLAVGGGITYALTAPQGGKTLDVTQPAPPGVSSPTGSHQPPGSSTPTSAGSPSAPSQSASPSEEADGPKDEDEGEDQDKETGPTTAPGDGGGKPAESPSAPPETKPSPTVKEPTPVSTACTGWAHENRSDGYGYLAENSHLYTGPYAECQYVTVVKTGVKLYYHCYVTNAYGNKWIYARIEGTNTEGWAHSPKLTRESGTLARC
ncbi:serine/threonine-protein kinase [Streptomyces sp. NPDC049837]|uniref:serine/threonine-protein kinase n=1 Tax=Streptomyces sp. NPDC049837 TaxID=3155277 RepID=UPI00343B6C9D